MAVLAFITAPAFKAEENINVKTTPQFKKRWWHKPDRLDARPVIWSLDNNPQDWDWNVSKAGSSNSEGYMIRHIPSNHKFWVSGRPHLWDTSCSCHTGTSNYFQIFHGMALKRAVRRWHNNHIMPARNAELAKIAEQFEKHFVS